MTTELNHTPPNDPLLSVSRAMTNTTEVPNHEWAWNPWVELYCPYANIAHLIDIIGIPVVLFFGSFGNAMIVIIMLRLPDSGPSTWLLSLAIFDQLVLLVVPVPEWLNMMYDVPLFDSLGSWPCKVDRLLTYATPILSSWTLVALTMQRAASVLWPHRISAVWTKRKSRAVVGVLVVVIFLVHAHFLYGLEYDVEVCHYTITKCCTEVVSKTYEWFFTTVWSWLTLLQFCILPFTLMVASNAVLLWKLLGSVRAGKQQRLERTVQESRQQRVSSLTVTLVTVSVSFLLLTTPICVFFVIYRYTQWYQDPLVAGQIRLFRAVSNFMSYVNSGINFYLYCLTGSRFRAEFRHCIVQFFSLFRHTQAVHSDVMFTQRSAMTSSGGGGVVTEVAKASDGKKAVSTSDF